jgi:hypothetical protein
MEHMLGQIIHNSRCENGKYIPEGHSYRNLDEISFPTYTGGEKTLSVDRKAPTAGLISFPT